MRQKPKRGLARPHHIRLDEGLPSPAGVIFGTSGSGSLENDSTSALGGGRSGGARSGPATLRPRQGKVEHRRDAESPWQRGRRHAK